MSLLTQADSRSMASMRIERNIAIAARDGTILRGNLYRPDDDLRYPVIVSSTPYGKDVHPRDITPIWRTVETQYPEILAASSCQHLTWECPDPEVWTANGYAILQVDHRGSGKSAGVLQPNSPTEADDGHDVIEWAVSQDWCDGSAGLLGLGYITCTNWRVAERKPKGLKAAIFCQGTCDLYRDRARTDGIYNSAFNAMWWDRHGAPNQHGNSDTSFRDMYTGEPNTGPERFAPEYLAANRIDYPASLLAHPLRDDWFKARTAELSAIDIPALVIANWGGLGLQLRGTVNGWRGLGSRDKWLKIEGGSYFFTFLTPQRVALLKSFFDQHLKGLKGDWDGRPRVEVAIRSIDDQVAHVATGSDWPLPDVTWKRLYLDLDARSLGDTAPAAHTLATYSPGNDEVLLMTAPLADGLTFVGPMTARLWLSCETEDTDLFITVRLIGPDGDDVSFLAATDPASPPTQGWLRVSQRKLDLDRSSEFFPVHAHDERQPLEPGTVYPVDVSIWPTGIEVPPGYRLALVVGGADFAWPEETGKPPQVVPMLHNDPRDRPLEIFGGRVVLHSGPDRPAYLALPALFRHLTDEV